MDTANVYGMGLSETMIGNYIKNNGNPFVIATKASISRDPETQERTFDNSSQHLETELNKSLERLGVDYVDLFYIHRRDPRIPIEEVMETLLKFKKEGKIGGIGFSEISPSSLRRASEVGLVDAVQSEYSLWTRSAELGLIQTCVDLVVSFIPFSPLCPLCPLYHLIPLRPLRPLSPLRSLSPSRALRPLLHLRAFKHCSPFSPLWALRPLRVHSTKPGRRLPALVLAVVWRSGSPKIAR